MANNLGFVPSTQTAPGGGAAPAAAPAPANNLGFVPAAGQSPAAAPSSQTGTPVNASAMSTQNQGGDPLQNGLNAVSIPTLFPSSPTDSPTAAGFKTAGNFVGSAVNFGLGLAKMPFQAIHDVGADIAGFNDAAQNFGGGLGGYLTAAKTLAENIIAPGGNPFQGSAFKALAPQSTQQLIAGDTTGAANTIENDPVGQILPFLLLGREAAYKISPEAGAAFDSGITKTAAPVEAVASKAADLGGKMAGAAGDAGRFVVGQATGLFPKTIDTITDNPGAFSKEGIANTDRPTVAGVIKDALDTRIADLDESGSGYQKVRDTGQVVPVDPDYLKNLIEQKTGLTVSGDGTNDSPYELKTTGNASLRNPSDLKAIQGKILNVWQPEFAKGYLTSNEFLNLRGDLRDMANYEGLGKSKPLENMSSIMRGQLNTDFRDNFSMPTMTPDELTEWQKENPGKRPPKNLTELDANFASQAGELKGLRAGILDKNDNLTDAAINKIANATNKGRSVFLDRLEEISPGITKKITVLKAIEDIENAEGQKVGTYARAGKDVLAGGLGYAAGGPVAAVAAAIFQAILASPKVAVPILRAYGFSSELVGAVLDRLKSAASDINNSTVGAGPIAPHVPKALASAGDYLKENPPGLTMKDVSGDEPPKVTQIYNYSDPEYPAMGKSQFFTPYPDNDYAYTTGPNSVATSKFIDEAKLYKGESSYDWAEKNGLMDKAMPADLQKLTGFKTLREVAEASFNGPSFKEGASLEYDQNPNIFYTAFQQVADRALAKEGYAGALWSHEDDLTPTQYQIWDKTALMDKMPDEALRNDQALLQEAHVRFNDQDFKRIARSTYPDITDSTIQKIMDTVDRRNASPVLKALEDYKLASSGDNAKDAGVGLLNAIEKDPATAGKVAAESQRLLKQQGFTKLWRYGDPDGLSWTTKPDHYFENGRTLQSIEITPDVLKRVLYVEGAETSLKLSPQFSNTGESEVILAPPSLMPKTP